MGRALALPVLTEDSMIKKYLPHTLILIGIIIIAAAAYIKISTSYYQEKLVEEYYSYIDSISSEPTEESVEPELPANEKPEEAVEVKESPVERYLKGKELSGIIEIPKLGVAAAILEGTDDRALKYTVGHYPQTAKPGEKGNCVLLGHRNYVYGHYFREINKLREGDLIILKMDTEEFTYTVTESFVVEPEDIWVLNDSHDAEVTLITCTPMVTYTHRLIVKGKLVE